MAHKAKGTGLDLQTRDKAYDLLMGMPLILWFGWGALRQWPSLLRLAAEMRMGTLDRLDGLQFFAIAASVIFNLLLVWLVLVRTTPVRKSRGWLPRFCGFAGTFLGVSILQLPARTLALPTQALVDILIFLGAAGSALALSRLGRSFAIMPEARVLVTGGVYAHVRHPLYTAEMLTLIGIVIQYAQPWATLIGIGVVLLQILRSIYEEQVLAEAFPDYTAYQARTWRFVPYIF
jgi:protein-S-isoprenylcysteine O-methyltransferase Ste14